MEALEEVEVFFAGNAEDAIHTFVLERGDEEAGTVHQWSR
jgi:hypothetical protein